MKKFISKIALLLFLVIIFGCTENNKENKAFIFFNAIVNHNNKKIEEMLNAGLNPNMNINADDGAIPIFTAISLDNTEAVKLLIKYGADVNVKEDLFGGTPIQKAALAGREDIVKLLIEAGAKINVVNYNNDTPLSGAASAGHIIVLNYLLKHGAKVNIKDNKGQNALFLAVYNKKYNCIESLLKAGININYLNNFGVSPLYLAIENEDTDIVKLLLEYGADPNLSKVYYNNTPLMRASSMGLIDIVDLLLNSKHIKVNYIDDVGKTALDYATFYKRNEIIALLKSHGAKTAKKLKQKKKKIFEEIKNG